MPRHIQAIIRWEESVEDLFCPETDLPWCNYFTPNTDPEAYEKDGPIHVREVHCADIQRMDKLGNTITFVQEFGTHNTKVLVEACNVEVAQPNESIELRRRVKTHWKAVALGEGTVQEAMEKLSSTSKVYGQPPPMSTPPMSTPPMSTPPSTPPPAPKRKRDDVDEEPNEEPTKKAKKESSKDYWLHVFGNTTKFTSRDYATLVETHGVDKLIEARCENIVFIYQGTIGQPDFFDIIEMPPRDDTGFKRHQPVHCELANWFNLSTEKIDEFFLREKKLVLHLSNEQEKEKAKEKEKEAKEKAKISLKFVRLTLPQLSCNQVDVEPDAIIGDVINAYPLLKETKAIAIMLDDKVHGYLGYDYLLHKRFSDYPEIFNGLVKLYVHGHLAVHHQQYNIKYPFIYFNKGKAWPPAPNWKEGDAINRGPFLTWLGWGRGRTHDTPPYEDNCWKNLVVIKYPNGVGKVSNLLSWIMGSKWPSREMRDPFSNQLLLATSIVEELGTIMTRTLENPWTDDELPVLRLLFAP